MLQASHYQKEVRITGTLPYPSPPKPPLPKLTYSLPTSSPRKSSYTIHLEDYFSLIEIPRIMVAHAHHGSPKLVLAAASTRTACNVLSSSSVRCLVRQRRAVRIGRQEIRHWAIGQARFDYAVSAKVAYPYLDSCVRLEGEGVQHQEYFDELQRLRMDWSGGVGGVASRGKRGPDIPNFYGYYVPDPLLSRSGGLPPLMLLQDVAGATPTFRGPR